MDRIGVIDFALYRSVYMKFSRFKENAAIGREHGNMQPGPARGKRGRQFVTGQNTHSSRQTSTLA